MDALACPDCGDPPMEPGRHWNLCSSCYAAEVVPDEDRIDDYDDAGWL